MGDRGPKLGIRREDKHRWERRAPLTPSSVRSLCDAGFEVLVQPSQNRAYSDAAYQAEGGRLSEELSSADLVLAVKEIPIDLIRPDQAYFCFSHTIKGQPQNMPALRRTMEVGATLMDYERLVDEQGRRLVFFGRHAGYAGMIDTLAVLGLRLKALGMNTPFLEIELAHRYRSLEHAKSEVRRVGALLAESPLPKALQPLVVGFAGYGNVSQGAQLIYDLLDPVSVAPGELDDLEGAGLFKVVFEEQHLVEAVDGTSFELQDYYQHPDRYRSTFSRHAKALTVLINAIYWTEAYPRLLTLEFLENWFAQERSPKLKVIGDISCDLHGAVASTVKATTPGLPAYIYEPRSRSVVDGTEGPGLCMMTTDCLPCELPEESSLAFAEALLPQVLALKETDFQAPWDQVKLPETMKRATIVWRGVLLPDYEYLRSALP